MPIPFTKYHALGNDYIVIQPDSMTDETIPVSLIQRICDRHFGAGSDGILFGPFPSKHADFELRIYNPDGSEAEKSGNGLRIFARYLWDKGYLKQHQPDPNSICSNPFTIQTPGGVVTARIHENGEEVSVKMGKADFNSKAVQIQGPSREVIHEIINIEGQELQFCAVSLGNPHCVIQYPHITPEIACFLGPKIEMDERFLNRTNVQFYEILDHQNIRIEIWERGAGYTLASGSSSCAVAAVAHRLQLCDSNVVVHNPGGRLQVSIAEDQFTLKGPVIRVYTGFFDLW